MVAPTTSDHKMSQSELSRLLMSGNGYRDPTDHNSVKYDHSKFDNELDFWIAYVARFYGPDSAQIVGKTWGKIAEMIDKYCQVSRIHGSSRVLELTD